MKIKRTKIEGPDELDVLSAIWILACNDDNPAITYEGIKYRLGLSETYDVENLIRSRSELFRRRIPLSRLEKWKQEMMAGKHLPSWIRDLEDEKVRKVKIETLKPDDLFRSQFRTEADAPRSPIEIIDWGLEHIDRLRKAAHEAREERSRRVTGLWIPLLSMLVALTAVVSSALLQRKSINTQVEMKKYETVFKPKQEGYAAFMRALAETFESAYHKNRESMILDLVKLEASYFSLEPFLGEQERPKIWEKYQEFARLCYRVQVDRGNSADGSAVKQETVQKDEFVKAFFQYKEYFRDALHRALFRHEELNL